MTHAWVIVLAIGCGGDGPGDDCPGFSDVVGGTFAREPGKLVWTLEVASMPAELTMNREEVPDFVLEFGWGVDIDTNGDGERDWEVAAQHFKMPGLERITNDPLTVTQEGLWRVVGAGASLSGLVDARLDGTTFTFELDESEDPDLVNITSESQSTWTTFYLPGDSVLDQCKDTYRP